LDGGMSLQRVRRSWEFLNDKAGLDRHLSEVKLVTDGQSIFKICRRDGEVMDALKEGQMAFFVAIDDIATSVDSSVRSFQDDRERFVRAYGEANRIARQGDAKAVLMVGKDEWPLPIPIVKVGAGWRFDTKEGKEEILNRRIGRNELSAMQAVLAYVDAQREYYLRNPQGDKLLHYAQKFTSSPGKRDGLYFPTKAGEKPSPLGPLYASAKAEGYAKGDDAYHGYHYRIIRGQGASAPGGAYDYVVQGRMIGGFALVAWPASYGNSGVMTFIVNHDGLVYEKDLGQDTAAAVKKITRFNPDKSWKRP